MRDDWKYIKGNYFPSYPLRISEELMDKVKEDAKKNKRSVNKQLEFIIEKYFEEKNK